MIDLYFWPTPNGHKISIALEELGLPYNVQMININENEQFAPDFLAIAPNNRIPAIVDHDGSDGSVSLFESGAILYYLANKTGALIPEDAHGQKTVMEWLMWQMGGFGPMLGQAHHFNYYAKEKLPYAIERYSAEANRLYRVLDNQLADKDFVAGNALSIADIAIFPWTRTHARQNVEIENYPNVAAWRIRMIERPAVLRGMKVGSESRKEINGMDDSDWRSAFGATA
jgi:GST-like protein